MTSTAGRAPTAPSYPKPATAIAAALAMIAAVAGALRFPTWPMSIAYLTMATVAITAATIDARTLRLPDPCTYGLIAGGLVTLLLLQWTGVHNGVVSGLIGGILYGGVLLAVGLIKPQAIGLGDIKLAAGLGIWLASASANYFVIGIMAGQLGLLVWALIDRGLHRQPREIPAGPALVAGALIALLIA